MHIDRPIIIYNVESQNIILLKFSPVPLNQLKNNAKKKSKDSA